MYKKSEFFFSPKTETLKDPIQHVIVLMMENNSFDRKLGSVHQVKPDIDGVDPQNLRSNPNKNGAPFFQTETQSLQMPLDPLHGVADVAEQLKNNNTGFLINFNKTYPKATVSEQNEVMAYYPFGFLPALHSLATEFTVCDHWYSSVPGPTWPNRFFALSGTSNGCIKMLNGLDDPQDIPELWHQTQPTLFDRLDEKKIPWKVYCGDFPLSVILTHNREFSKLKNYHCMQNFYEDVKGNPLTFPAFTFIEPKYMGEDQNDDHPPHNTMKAEKLIADVYNAIRGNEALWENTLLVVTYDEHGGFYDHKIPPAATPPDDKKQEGYSFNQYGLAVPALLISPYADNSVCQTVFDHTSILKYLIDKYQLGALGRRTATANSIASALNFNKPPRKDCLKEIKIPEELLLPSNPHWVKHDQNQNQTNIHKFADFIATKAHRKIFSPKKEIGNFDKITDFIGAELESWGLIKLGMFFRKSADAYRQERIKRTMEIAYQMMPNLKPKVARETLEFEDETTEVDELCGILSK